MSTRTFKCLIVEDLTECNVIAVRVL